MGGGPVSRVSARIPSPEAVFFLARCDFPVYLSGAPHEMVWENAFSAEFRSRRPGHTQHPISSFQFIPRIGHIAVTVSRYSERLVNGGWRGEAERTGMELA